MVYINTPNPVLSKAHLTTLNLNNFKKIEAVGLRIIALGSPPPHHLISPISPLPPII
jgi:hypothetical protein